MRIRSSNRFIRAIAIAAMLGLGSFACTAEELRCPASSKIHQSMMQDAPLGWENLDSSDVHYLSNILFFDGEPKNLQYELPVSEIRGAEKIVATWKFEVTKSSYWIACEYAGSTATLIRRLDRAVKSCQVEFDAKFPNRKPLGVKCSE